MSNNDDNYDFDLFIIGGGSGGLSCSKAAAKYGVKVAVADFVTPSPQGSTWGLGGTCVNVGCIPKKLMHQAALLGEAVSDAKSFGLEVADKPSHRWTSMVSAIQDHIASLNLSYEVQLEGNSIKYFNKLVSLKDPHTLVVRNEKGEEEKEVTSKYIVLAMGGRPVYPDVPGVVENSITSDDLFSLKRSPGKTLLCGASYISLECAGFLYGMGYDVTVMVRSIFLRGFDQEMANKVAEYMEDQGVNFLKQHNLVKMEKREEGKVRVTFTNAEGEEVWDEFDTVVMATGRKPLTESVGLENAGVQLNPKSGFVITNDSDQTNVENIFAIGDIAEGRPELTPVAIQAGQLLADRLFNESSELCDYTTIPTTVFTPLEYSCCGYSEEDAIAKYGEENIEVYHSNFTPLETILPNRLINGCFAKLVTNLDDDQRILGIHMLGPNSGEVVQGFSLALKLGGKKKDFDRLVGIHPTNAEVFTTMGVTKRSGIDIGGGGCEG